MSFSFANKWEVSTLLPNLLKIPVCSTNIDESDVQAVADCVRSGWLSRYAPVVAEFEQAFAKYCGCKYGVSTCSCSTALDLALQSLGVGKGDEVVVPTFTMVATANAVVHVGAKPVFVDCDSDTWNINPIEMQEKFTDKIKAIIPVHIYGHMCNIGLITAAAKNRYIGNKYFYNGLKRDYDFFVIEDAAEVHGAESHGVKAGVQSDAACYSFFANKNMTTGEGGMIVTNDASLAKEAQRLKANYFGLTPQNHFLHEKVANTVCMSGMQAALGLSQLKRLDSFVEQKRGNAHLYNELLADLAQDSKITLPVEREGYKNVYWMYSILINDSFGLNRDELIMALAKDGVETRPFFTSMHQQPIYKKYAKNQEFPVADDISKRGLNLPSASNLTFTQVQQVCELIHKHANRR